MRWTTCGVSGVLFWSLVGCSRPQPVSTADLIERLAVRGPETYNALAERKEVGDVRLVEAALGHRRSRVRAGCARLIGSYQDVTRVDSLLPLLDDPVATVREAAAHSVFRLWEVGEVLSWIQRRTTSRRARQALMLAVLDAPVELLEPEWLEWLLGLEGDPELEASMFSALSRHGRPQGNEREALERAYERLLARARRCAQSPRYSWELRVEALQFWTNFAPGEVIPLALYWSGSPDVSEYARESGMAVLGRCGQNWLAGYLRSQAENTAVPIRQRRAALASLVRYMDPKDSADYLLRQSATVADPRFREEMYFLMSHHPQAVDLLPRAGERELNRDLAAQLSRLLADLERRRP